jgi:hypothetical protein
MHRAECLAVLLLLALAMAGCGQSQQPPPSAASTERLVRIARFDCAHSEESEAQFPWSQGIASWSGGGPGGAAWNIGKLRCAVELQTNCSRGAADVELRVGGALAGHTRASIEKPGLHLVTFELTAPQWEQHFDEGSALTGRFAYRTATFSATAIASCQAPEAFGPGNGPRLEFADDRHFTAGFASGE